MSKPEPNCQLNGGLCTLSRKQRLLRSSLFRQAYDQNHRFSGRFMTLWLRKDADSCLRLGVVASRRIGNAVARNRAKRRLREVFRLNRRLFDTTDDAVLVARRAILRAAWTDIEKELLLLAQKAGILLRDSGQSAGSSG